MQTTAALRVQELHQARLGEAMNHMVAKLRAVGQDKPDFSATVSHELRTSLTSIAGYVEMLREERAGPLTSAQVSMLEAVDRNIARLRHAIEDALTISKIESGTFRTTRQPVNLVEVAAEAIKALHPVAAATGLTLRLDSPGGPVIVAGDPGQLGRLVMNLLANAVTFTSSGGRITAGAKASGEVATMTVRHTGIGIAAGQSVLGTRLFPASRASDEPIPGTGLGLLIARAIVANHGGELAVHSPDGQGTTVIARIPLLPPRQRQEPAHGGEPPRAGQRVAKDSRTRSQDTSRADPRWHGR